MAAVTQSLAVTIVAQRGDPRPPVGRLQRSADRDNATGVVPTAAEG